MEYINWKIRDSPFGESHWTSTGNIDLEIARFYNPYRDVIQNTYVIRVYRDGNLIKSVHSEEHYFHLVCEEAFPLIENIVCMDQ